MQIKELKIYSSNVQAQADFYSKVLGVKIISQTDRSVNLYFGLSILIIEHKQEITPYHFAINIPANKEIEALNWLRTKVDILKDGESEIQAFDFWNAKAIYFYDQDKNIVELIARKNLNNLSNQKFNSKQFLEISEIGLPTLDIEKEFNQLRSLTGIEMFDGNFERFCAIGDENGLFICINKELKDWFPTNDKAFSSDFEIKLIVKGTEHIVAYESEKLKAVKV